MRKADSVILNGWKTIEKWWIDFPAESLDMSICQIPVEEDNFEFVRMYYGQLDKEGYIIDERFNGGGQLADRFLELMQAGSLQSSLATWTRSYASDQRRITVRWEC